jgi:hypothetical protein
MQYRCVEVSLQYREQLGKACKNEAWDSAYTRPTLHLKVSLPFSSFQAKLLL